MYFGGSVTKALLAIAVLCSGPISYAQTTAAIQPSGEYVQGEIIVKLKSRKASTLTARAFLGKALAEKGMTLKGSWSGLNMHHLVLKKGDTVEKTIADLQNDPEVEYVEPNYIVHRQSLGREGEAMSMDTARAASVSIQSAGVSSQTSAPIGETTAWTSQTAGLQPAVVAVIDTGLDYNHQVFVNSGAVWTNPNEIAANQIDDDSNGYIDDVHGWNFVANNNAPMDDDDHGTHVSGIILGTSQDITAPTLQPATIKIMPLKFLDSTGSGTTSDAVKAIYYAVNNGAKVLNNSWGGGSFSNALLDALTYAYSKQVVVVAAAGNASSNNDSSPTYPANYNVPNMISVAATTDADGWASFSNYGAQTVHVGSPGNSIYSTFPNNMWGRASGTSMATPFVSGMAALMVREQPSMNGYQVKQLIFSAGNKISSLVNRTSTQARMYIPSAMTMAKSASVSSSQPSYDEALYRAPASDDGSSSSVPACGLVAKAMYDSRDGGGGPSNLAFFGVLLVLISPIFISVLLRNRDTGRQRRRHERFEIASQVTMKIGGRELTGLVSSISMGGVQVNTDAWLENGGVLTMSISSPDGRESISVQGKVVWSEEQKRYGVAFSEAEASVKSAIARWTKGLMPT